MAESTDLRRPAPLPVTKQPPQPPITWTRSPDGTINAQVSGQTLTASGKNQSDGSWQKQAAYARTGQAPYLTMTSVGDAAARKTSVTFAAGTSQLTLAVTDIDAAVTSGTATLSGTWNGAAVNWTSRADLTKNAFVTNPIKGWPAGAFITQLQEAAVFAPLGNVLAQSFNHPPGPMPVGKPLPVSVGVGKVVPGREPAVIRPMDTTAGGVIGRAGSWCLGGVVVAAGAPGPDAVPLTYVLACAGGAGASLASDLMTYIFDDAPPQEDSIPPIDVPPDPEQIGPVTQSGQDDPPPPPNDGDGSGGPPPIDSGGDGSGGGSGGGGDGGGGGGGGDDTGLGGGDTGSPKKED